MVNIEIGEIKLEILDLGKIVWEKLIEKNGLGKLYYSPLDTSDTCNGYVIYIFIVIKMKV